MTSLSGRVTVPGEGAAKNAVVEIHNAKDDVVDQVQTDDDGRYTYHLAPGKWTAVVWDPYGHRGRAEVELAEGEDKQLDIELTEGDAR
ncbi:MAG: carboxypeptidase-like regulatory domain-containing protein [Actinomycetota bacterium]